MRSQYRYFFLFLLLLSARLLSQTVSNHQATNSPTGFVKGGDVFGVRVFMENKGQFGLFSSIKDSIHFVLDDGYEKIYFTDKGLVYELIKDFPLSEREADAIERGEKLKQKAPELHYVFMNWIGDNRRAISLEASEKLHHYITYGGPEYNAHTYKKLTYKNVYAGIDIEYSIPEDKHQGIKYSIILHEGADPAQVKMLYSGDVRKIKQSKNKEILILTPLGDIIEHLPVSYYENKEVVNSEFKLNSDTICFNFPEGYKKGRRVIIDPWVTAITTLANNNYGYDVDYDNNNNLYVYGGNTSAARCKVAMYNPAGVLQWTFSGTLVSPSWNSGTSWTSNFKVHKPSGKTYMGRHISGPAGVIRLDPSGNYDNFISSGGSPAPFEMWNIDFACNGDLITFGGATLSQAPISVVTGSIGTATTFSPGVVTCCQDVLAEVTDPVGELYVYLSGHPIFNNTISKIAPSYTSTIWNAPSMVGSFVYLQSKNLYVGATAGNAVAFNALAVNMNYLYFYDGASLAAYNKTNGSMISSTLATGLTSKVQGGIAVDDCNNVYVGGNGSIRCFNFNGTSFSTLTAISLSTSPNFANEYVYDIQLNRLNNTLHVAGSGFVGNYSAIHSTGCVPVVNSCVCIQPYLSVTTSSTNCVNIGASTVVVAGMPGPYTYSWMPGGQTSSVITGINPGTYTVSATSTSCNITTSAITVFTSALPPYQLNVATTSITCASLGSASVNLTGMPGPFSYTWTPTAQTGSAATGLSPGIYTLTVYSAGCNLTFTTTTQFTSLIPLTGNIAYANSVTCNGASTATGAVTNLAGGSGTQYFSWYNGASNYTTAATNSLSAGVWTVDVTDALTGCNINQVILILQPPPLSLGVAASSPTACVGTSITLVAGNSGGTPGALTPYTYTWTGGAQTDTYSILQNTAGNYVYTVNSSDANNCLSTNTIAVNFVPNPTLSVSNVSICPLKTGTLTASGASTYTWTSSPLNPTGSTFTDNPIATQQYTVVGSALSCTASTTASIILKPVPVPLFSSNSPICNGQNLVFSVSTATSAVWSGVLSYTSSSISNTISAANPNQSGAYQVTVTAANSCTAATSGTVTIHPTPTVSATGGTVCVSQTLNLSSSSFAGATYVWAGPNAFVSNLQNPNIINPPVSASGNYTVKATSIPGCTNTAIANVTVTALPLVAFTSNSPRCFGSTLNFNSGATSGALTYSWSGPNGFNSTLQNPNIPNVTVPASGNYVLLVTTGPCTASVTHPATIHPLPSPIAFNTSPACEGKSVQLSVNNCGVTYQWLGPNGFSSSAITQTLTNVTLTQSGIYSVTVIDANTCQNASTTSVTILQNPIISASGDLVCFGDSAQLSAVGAANYYWMGPASFTANVTNPIVAPTINTQVWTYTVVGYAVNGCTAVTTTTIGTRVLPIPTVTVTPRICVKSEIKLQGQGGDLYQWTGPLGYYSTLQNPSFIAWNIGMAGTYSLMVTDVFGCKGYTSATIMVDSEPGGSLIGEHMSGCVPFCSTYSLLASGSTSVSNTLWQIGQQSFSSPSFSYCFFKAGEYEVKGSFENEKNCKGNVNFMIQAYALPEADFEYSPAKPIENEGPVMFTNTSRGDKQNKWHWAFINNQGYTSNTQHTAYTFEDAGMYVVAMTVENTYGCMDTILKTIEVLPDFHVYIPNAFTPNEDGLNDLFFPVMRGVKTFNINIFDRWGELIFASNDPTHIWDGTYKGKPVKEGAYNWKLSVLSNAGEEKNYTGTVMVYR